jgi:polar amino acid transport system substrate-binding protein
VKSGNPKNITAPQDIEGKTVALQKGNLLFQGALEQLSSNVTIVYFDTIHELISAVVAGTVDFSILDETAPYLAKKMGLLNYIEVAFPVGEPFDLVFLLRNDWPELTSIINKGFLSIHEEERIEIRDSWFSSDKKQINWDLLSKLISVFAIILGFIVYWIYTLKVSRYKTEAALLQLEAKEKELEAKNKILEISSITDRLTQLYNREKLDEALEAEIIRAERYHTLFGVVMIDIDFFKNVNDVHGHQTGDHVLFELSAILKNHSRKADIVGRWGGEEFLIICPNTEKEGLATLAESLRMKIERHIFPIVGAKTASFGLTMYQPKDTRHSVLSRADHALYLAKDRGRNRVETCYT